MKNLWPDVNDIKSTEDVMPFLKETIESLQNNYDGKIKAEISFMKTASKSAHSMRRTLADTKEIANGKFVGMSNKNFRASKRKYSGNTTINTSYYNYQIYNKTLYCRLFTICISEFYPLTIQVCEGILKDYDVEIEINNLDDLKTNFSAIVNSPTVKMIIKKMIK